MTEMFVLRRFVPFAVLLVLAGCRDAVAPSTEPGAATPLIVQLPDSDAHLHVIQQAATAPPLETYQVAFWAHHDRETLVAVDYQSGDPFMRFHIPKWGLMRGPDGTRFWGRDSVLITLTVDTVNLAVEFQPSGLAFSKVFAAQLVVWYTHANPDLNGDGVVDDADRALEGKLGIWGHSASTTGWFKVASKANKDQQYVLGNLYHFSQYAVSW